MPFSGQEVAQMSQRADERFMTAEQAPAIEPFASIMEYADRLGSRHLWMLQQLERLRERPERWIVAGPARVEEWHVGAIVVGPPGFFLIWPKTTRVEPALWETLRACRDHVQRSLGEHSRAAVEVVVFSPSDERGHMQRWMDTEFDMLTAYGNDLDRLLVEWRPVSGAYLSAEWRLGLATASNPRETLLGPDRGAHQQYPNWSAPRADRS
jgi:hypothetical protein